MSANLPSIYGQQFASNIMLKLQQKQSKLMPYVMSGSHKGEQASPVDQIDKVEMQEVLGRFSPIVRVDAAVDRRWVVPSKFDLAQHIDSFDKLQLLLDPSSSYVQNAVQAANRKYDDIILDAFFGTAKTGKSGSTNTSFAAASQVAVNHGASGNTGLTVAKLREAKRILMANQVQIDEDPLVAAVKAKQHDNLLAEVQVIDGDYREAMGANVKGGKVLSVLDINIVHCERLDQDGSSYDRVPLWAKSGFYLGKWMETTTDVSQRKDLSSLPWQAYVYMMAGATRLEEGRCIEIKCA